MSQLLRVVFLGVAILCVNQLTSCKENPPAPAKKSGSDDPRGTGGSSGDGSSDDFGRSDDDDDDDDNDDKDRDDECRDERRRTVGFRLASAPTYDDDIEQILQDNCVSCHGDKPPNLESYSKARSNRRAILDSVESGEMPPASSGKLSSKEKELLGEWVDANAPENSSDLDDDDDRDEDGDSRSDDDCDSDSDSDSDDEFVDELLKTEEFEICKNKNKLYDRVNDECHNASIAESYSCNEDGIADVFKKVGVSVTSDLRSLIKSGFKIDQCGEYRDEPIVYLYKTRDDDDKVTLKVRKLCKQGSEAC